jgi:predicted permease
MTMIVLRSFPFVVKPDWRILTFTIFVSLLTGIFFGLAPALRATRFDLTPALKDSPFTLGRDDLPTRLGLHLGKGLVVIQVALSMIVLVGAGLLVRTLTNLRSINPGFDTQNLLLFGIDPTLAKYDDSRIRNLYSELQERLGALPGVMSASYSSDTLLSGSLWTTDVHVEGQTEKATQEVDTTAAGPGFFQTLRIPVLSGRTFASADFEQAGRTAIFRESPQLNAASAALPIPVLVNRQFAREYFPGQNPIGKRIVQGGSSGASGEGLAVGKPKQKVWEIIGIAGDVKYENLRREIHPMVYVPAIGGATHFELRTSTDPAALVPAVRKVVTETDANLPIFQVKTQSQRIDESLTRERMISHLASFFGLLALFLACIGLYGLLAYEVTRRTREIGVRIALGADKTAVFRHILQQGLKSALIGMGVGVLGAFLLMRLLSSMLYGVQPLDPFTFAVVAFLWILVALSACYIPARRAMSVDPIVALRHE